MKNTFKLTLVVFGLTFFTTVNAQTSAKTAPIAPVSTAKQDTTKKTAPAGATTNTSAPSSTKTAPVQVPATGTKGEPAGGGTNKMAINEQGIPTKKRVNASGISTSPETPAVPETPKKKD